MCMFSCFFYDLKLLPPATPKINPNKPHEKYIPSDLLPPIGITQENDEAQTNKKNYD